MSEVNQLYSVEKSTLTNIADAIRTKKGTSKLIPVPQLAPEILTISGGGSGGYTPTNEDLTFEGQNINNTITYFFGFNNFNWLIDNFGDRIKLLPNGNPYNISNTYLFWNSTLLKSTPNFLKMLENNIINFSSSGLFYNCYSLTEILKLSIEYSGGVSVPNGVYNSLTRLRRVTVKPRENTDSLAVTDWSFRGAGYVNSPAIATQNPDVFPIDKQITDDNTYQALKDDPMSWTSNIAYSQFNKQSVIEFFNSLPIVNKGSKLSFKSGTGAATEGGDIGSLTSDELDIAKSKGWTNIDISS